MFTKDTTLNEIYSAKHIRPIRDALVSGGNYFGANGHLTLDQLQQKNPTGFSGDILYGLQRLETDYEVHNVYDDPRLTNVKLTWLPAEKKRHDTFMILMAGGAYGAVCTMVESLPVAAKLNELGYDCFCLNYRTAVPESFVKGLLPEPMDDLATALQYIAEKKVHFGVNPNDYAVSGFSAGGHLASTWGTAHLGARKYGLPQPKCMLLGYPLISMANVPESPVKQYLCTGMFGAGYTQEDIEKYDASCHVDTEYPPCYIVRAMDDTTVSIRCGDVIKDALGERCMIEQAQTGGHGFGLGSDTPLNGWVERATAWMEGL